MIIGVCGFSYTGSGAVIDFLQEFDNTQYKYDYEFLFPYYPDGIEDLEYHLTQSYTKYASGYVAIERYKRLTYILTYHLNRLCTQQRIAVEQVTTRYLNELIQSTWKGYTTADIILSYGNKFEFCVHTLIDRLLNRIYKKCFRKKITNLYPMKTIKMSIEPFDFLILTKNYFADLLSIFGYEEGKIAILDQPFSVNHPLKTLRFFKDAKAIVVDRDPRDLFLYAKYFLKNKATQIPTDTVENFVEYFKIIRKGQENSNSDLLLHIKFEDLIYDYDDTRQKLIKFCNLGKHIKPCTLFNPRISIQNTYMMNKFSYNPKDIDYIERHLENYLYDFDINKVEMNKDNMFC